MGRLDWARAKVGKPGRKLLKPFGFFFFNWCETNVSTMGDEMTRIALRDVYKTE